MLPQLDSKLLTPPPRRLVPRHTRCGWAWTPRREVGWPTALECTKKVASVGPQALGPSPREVYTTPHRGVGGCSPPAGGWMAKSIWDPSPSGAGGHRMARGYTRVNVVYHFFEVRDRTPCQDCLPVCLRHPVIHLCRQHRCTCSARASGEAPSQCNKNLFYDIAWRM